MEDIVKQERIVLNRKLHEVNKLVLQKSFEDFFERASLLNVVLDDQGIILQVNAAWGQKMGWEPHELINCRFLDLLHPNDLSVAGKMLKMMSLHGKNTEGFKCRFKSKDGQYLALVWNLFPSGHRRFGFGIARVTGMSQ